MIFFYSVLIPAYIAWRRVSQCRNEGRQT